MANENGNNKNGNTIKAAQHKAEFIRLYPQYGTIGLTLKAIGIKTRWTFYKWCKNDAAFKKYYQEELLPNERDENISLLREIARGKVKASPVQLTALFGFLKATNRIRDEYSPFDFVEKSQVEIGNTGAQPFVARVEIDISGNGKPFREITT